MSTDQTSVASLRDRWQDFKTQNPKVRIRDAAAQLGVSEAELLWTGVGAKVTRLRPEWGTLLQKLESVGVVTALTRNESAVHEKHGVYAPVEVDPAHILVLGKEIDLRLFPRGWAMGFHVETQEKDGVRHSFQIFDKTGTAIHKLFSKAETNLPAFQALAAELTMPDAPAVLEIAPPSPPRAAERPDAEIDVAGFRQGWAGLQDTHDFYPLLGKFRLARTQALRLADPTMAWPVPVSALRATLELVAERGVPIMVFVGNPSAIQIHSGEVKRIVPMDHWINVLDPEFNLHVREDHLDRAWVVRKPTVDGIVTALELYDKAGDQVVQLFGKRKPGIPEIEAWRVALADATSKLTASGA